MKHKKEYEKLLKERREIIIQLDELSKDEKVLKYLELMKESKELISKLDKEYYYVKLDEYKKCQHVLVYSNITYDCFEGRTKKVCSCIKCGINDDDYNYDAYNLSTIGKARYDYLVNYCENGIKGTNVNIECDEELACAIFKKIKENNPNIDDKTAIKYFEIALDNIRNIKVSKERKESRIRRLDLRKRFDKWQ